MDNLTTPEALGILKKYSCVEASPPQTPEESQQLRDAIILITSLSDNQNIGICAEDTTQGLTSLSSYLKALGYSHQLSSTPELSQSVYIKYNAQKQGYYINPYEGTYRGVLISFQGDNDEVVGTYGHFPLDLFDETYCANIKANHC